MKLPDSIHKSITWRGLVCAVLLSLLAHGLMLFGVRWSSSFSFKGTASQASMSTRVIEAAAATVQASPELPRAAAQKPSAAPVAPTAAPLPERAPLATTPLANIATASNAPAPPSTEIIEENKALSPAPPIEFATNTIASLNSTSTNSDLTASVAQEAPAAGAQAGQEQKLAYPSSATLSFDGVQMRRGERRSGAAQMSWRTDGVAYDIALESRLLGIAVLIQTSKGLLSAQGLAPERYNDWRINRSEQASHFRRELGKIQFSNNKPEAQLLPGAQDRLSAVLQLAGILGGGMERFQGGQRIQMQVAGADSAELWEFIPEGMSEIELPERKILAFKLTRKARDEFDQRLEIWLAPELNFLPVRMRQSSTATPNEDFTDLVLRKLP